MSSMKNFQITAVEDGKKYWVSRAMAVCMIVIAYDTDHTPYILLQKRGPGCPDYVGAWSHTCGYLDFGETRREAVKRELWEELGIELKAINTVIHYSSNDNPGADPRQNVTERYVIQIPLEQVRLLPESEDSGERGGEVNEVSDLMLLPVDSEVEKALGDLEFAFNHRELTRSILRDPRFWASEWDRKFEAAMESRLVVKSRYKGLSFEILRSPLTGKVTVYCEELSSSVDLGTANTDCLQGILEGIE